MNNVAVPMPLVEIGPRTETGYSSGAYRCMGEDDRYYFVKTPRLAGMRAVIAEWLAAGLAEILDLPVMESCLVQIPSELITDDLRVLGHGIGFGSLELPQADHITFSAANRLPLKLRAEVLLFDYWIQNTDRILGAAGGNPNLLTSSERPLAIIDHGNAFEPKFDLISFINHHAFANTRSEWLDPSKRVKWEDRVPEALAMLESRWKSIPQEWQETVLGELQQEIALEKVRFLLNRSTSNTSLFWSDLISS